MDIGIILTSGKADRFRIRETLSKSGTKMISTIDRSLLPPKIVIYGDEDQILKSFEKMSNLPAKEVQSIAHIRGVSQKTINALVNPRIVTRAEFTGVFETVGIQATIVALNAALEVQGVEASEVQLSGGTGTRSLFVLFGRKSAVEKALLVAKNISHSTHISLDNAFMEGKGV
jgi:hypothetical protein